MAVFDVGIKTAMAIMNASLTQPWLPMGPIMMAIAAAMGAVQLAVVLSKPLPKASKGKLLQGASHAYGGIPIEAEGGEAIINKYSTKRFLPLLSLINEAGGGVPFVRAGSDGGFAIRNLTKEANQMYPSRIIYGDGSETGISKEDMKEIMTEALNRQNIYVAIEDIRKGEKNYAEVEGIAKS
jgi:hypothetical protein